MRAVLFVPLLSIGIYGCGSEPAGTVDMAVGGVEDLAAAGELDLTAAPTPDLAGASLDLSVGGGGNDGGPIIGPAPDGGFCHTYGWGAPAVSITTVGTLPTMTGGTIALGAYDAVAVTTTGGTTGSYRGTWVFESASQMAIYEQLTLSGPPPTPVPRTLTWSTSTNMLSRQQTCGGTMSFSNTYTARTDASGTFLDVRTGAFVFTYKKRP